MILRGFFHEKLISQIRAIWLTHHLVRVNIPKPKYVWCGWIVQLWKVEFVLLFKFVFRINQQIGKEWSDCLKIVHKTVNSIIVNHSDRAQKRQAISLTSLADKKTLKNQKNLINAYDEQFLKSSFFSFF